MSTATLLENRFCSINLSSSNRELTVYTGDSPPDEAISDCVVGLVITASMSNVLESSFKLFAATGPLPMNIILVFEKLFEDCFSFVFIELHDLSVSVAKLVKRVWIGFDSIDKKHAVGVVNLMLEDPG